MVRGAVARSCRVLGTRRLRDWAPITAKSVRLEASGSPFIRPMRGHLLTRGEKEGTPVGGSYARGWNLLWIAFSRGWSTRV